MIHNNVILRVVDAADPARLTSIRAALAEVCTLSLREPGCERFEVYHSRTEPSVFLLIEQWSDPAALTAHRQAPSFLEVLTPHVLPFVERAPHDCELLAPAPRV